VSTPQTGSTSKPFEYLLQRAIRACEVAKAAAAAAAQGIAAGSAASLDCIHELEKELDALDREIDAGVTLAITHPGGGEAPVLLACMKFAISLDRIGDLLLSFAANAQAAGRNLDPEDIRDLTQMAIALEKMLSNVGEAFATRDVGKAVHVLRADAEIDRLRNLIFLRYIESPHNSQRHAGLQVIFMTQSLDRAGDHAKNLAEEVCHLVSGDAACDVLKTYDKPIEEMFLEFLRQQQEILK